VWFLLEGNKPREKKNCYESNHRTRKKIRKEKRFFFHGLINNYINPNNYNLPPLPLLMLSGQLSKVFPNIPVGPNRNGLFHFISNRISWSLRGIESVHHFSHTNINIVQNSACTYSFYFLFIILPVKNIVRFCDYLELICMWKGTKLLFSGYISVRVCCIFENVTSQQFLFGQELPSK